MARVCPLSDSVRKESSVAAVSGLEAEYPICQTTKPANPEATSMGKCSFSPRARSEERRVGKESRVLKAPEPYKTNQNAYFTIAETDTEEEGTYQRSHDVTH